MKCFIYCIFGGNTHGKSQRCNKKSKTTFIIIFRVKTQAISFKTQEKTQNSRIKLKNSASHYSLVAEKMAKKQACFIGIHQKSLPESAKQMLPLICNLKSSQQTNALLTSPFFGPADLVHHTKYLPFFTL